MAGPPQVLLPCTCMCCLRPRPSLLRCTCDARSLRPPTPLKTCPKPWLLCCWWGDHTHGQGPCSAGQARAGGLGVARGRWCMAAGGPQCPRKEEAGAGEREALYGGNKHAHSPMYSSTVEKKLGRTLPPPPGSWHPGPPPLPGKGLGGEQEEEGWGVPPHQGPHAWSQSVLSLHQHRVPVSPGRALCPFGQSGEQPWPPSGVGGGRGRGGLHQHSTAGAEPGWRWVKNLINTRGGGGGGAGGCSSGVLAPQSSPRVPPRRPGRLSPPRRCQEHARNRGAAPRLSAGPGQRQGVPREGRSL